MDACSTTTGGWSRERVLFLLAGTVTLLSAALAAAVTPWFLLMTAAVGANQLLQVGRTGPVSHAVSPPRIPPTVRTPDQGGA